MVLEYEVKPLRILIIGAGDGGQVVANILNNMCNPEGWQNCYNVIGYIDDFKTGTIDGISILGGIDAIDNYDFDKVIISISTSQDFKKKIFDNLVKKRGKDIFINAIHKTSYIEPTAEIGAGNIIGAFVYIGHKAAIGDNNLISSHCSIEHHNIIGSHNTFGPAIQTSGRVKIGDMCIIGSRIMPHVIIGNNVHVAGDIPIWKNLPDNSHFVYNSLIPWSIRVNNNKKAIEK